MKIRVLSLTLVSIYHGHRSTDMGGNAYFLGSACLPTPSSGTGDHRGSVRPHG
jgi:hypothetical protein